MRGLEGGLKAFKSFLKKEKKRIKGKIKGKIKGYGTRFARVVSRAKAKSKTLIMHSLHSCFLKSKKHQYFARRHSLTAAYVNSKAKAVIRGGKGGFSLCHS